ncbi:MAG: acyl-CoA dehydrogenase family protein [Rhodomicrobium sp.]
MTYPLTKAQQALAQRALDFTGEFLDPAAAELDRGQVFPKALVGQLAAHNFLGLLAPEYSGVAGAGFVSHVEAVHAFSGSCPAIASVINNHALFAYAIAHWGSEAQKKQYLPALAKGEKLGAIGIQEDGPVLGTGPGALLATRQGSGFTLNGTKAFVRNAGVADVYLVFAIIRPDADNTRLTGFIVDAKTTGLTVGPRLETMGLKACPVAHLSFKDVSVNGADVMGTENSGSGIASQILSVSSVAEAAQTVGIARAAVSHAAEYARQRVQFRHPIARLQAIQTLLAEILTDSHMAWLGIQHVARLIEDEEPFEPEAAMVKLFIGRFGSRMLVDAIQIEGGMGICETVPKHVKGTLPLARMFRDIAGTTLFDAPDDFPDKLIAAGIL